MRIKAQQGAGRFRNRPRSPRIFPPKPGPGYPFRLMAAFPCSRHESHPARSARPFRSAKGRSLGAMPLIVLLVVLFTNTTYAQVGTEVAPSGVRGTIGGAVVGAETTMLIMGALRVRPVWAYALGGGLGAVAGGAGGYLLDEAGNTPVSMTLLVAGLLMAVPTTIVVLNATSYHPPQIGTGPRESLSKQLPAAEVGLSRTLALAQYHRESLALGVPAVEISCLSPATSPGRGRVEAGTRVLIPLFSATF